MDVLCKVGRLGMRLFVAKARDYPHPLLAVCHFSSQVLLGDPARLMLGTKAVQKPRQAARA